MARHAAYWQPFIDSGRMVVFGPVLDGTGSWGLGVVQADDEEELRAHAARSLARYKVPTTVHFLPALPHSLTGKVSRARLRELGLTSGGDDG